MIFDGVKILQIKMQTNLYNVVEEDDSPAIQSIEK